MLMKKEIIDDNKRLKEENKILNQEIERLNNIIDKKEQFLGDNIKRLEREVVKRDNIINELEKEIDRLLERQYESERFAEENGFCTYLPAKGNLLCVKNKLEELKGVDKK